MDRRMAAAGGSSYGKKATAVATDWVGGVFALLACWRDRARQRRELAQLDARGRADIGITRSDAVRECAKPFWRA